MSDLIDYPGEIFRVAFASGFYHPDLEVRHGLRRLLDAWLDSLHDTPSTDEVRRVILSERGTTIEPFILDETDLDCAVFLIRAAFSKELGQNRFRLVSRDTIGRDGGLVITRSLASYYVKRHPHNQCRGQPLSGWSFAPAIIPQSAPSGPAMTTAILRAEEEGFRITISLPECKADPAGYARQLQLGSRIYGVKESFDHLGLRVECMDEMIHVLSGSPESMIRCMAHMADKSTLILDGGKNCPHIPRMLVHLDLPGEEPLPLQAIIGSTPDYMSWFSGEVPFSLSLTNTQKLAITRWLRPPKDWLTANNISSP